MFYDKILLPAIFSISSLFAQETFTTSSHLAQDTFLTSLASQNDTSSTAAVREIIRNQPDSITRVSPSDWGPAWIYLKPERILASGQGLFVHHGSYSTRIPTLYGWKDGVFMMCPGRVEMKCKYGDHWDACEKGLYCPVSTDHGRGTLDE